MSKPIFTVDMAKELSKISDRLFQGRAIVSFTEEEKATSDYKQFYRLLKLKQQWLSERSKRTAK